MPASQMSRSDPESDGERSFCFMMFWYLLLSVRWPDHSGCCLNLCKGAVSALDDENACPSSQLMPCATDVTSGEGWFIVIVKPRLKFKF